MAKICVDIASVDLRKKERKAPRIWLKAMVPKATRKLIKAITSRYGQLISNMSAYGCGLFWENTKTIKLVVSG